MKPELRFYTFINMYLQGIHAGIQSAHVVHDAMIKYMGHDTPHPTTSEADELRDAQFARSGSMLFSWARNHKTMIVCNAGYSSNLRAGYNLFDTLAENVGLPYVKFHESQEALEGVMTGIGIVLPEHLFNVVDYRTANNTVTDARAFHERFPFKETQPGGWYHLYNKNEAILGAEPEIIVGHDYWAGSPEAKLLTWIKACPLAR